MNRKFWDNETQDITDYAYNRIRAFGYLPASVAMLTYETSNILQGDLEKGSPLFLVMGAFFALGGIRGALEIYHERRQN